MAKERCVVMYREVYKKRLRSAFIKGVGFAILTGVWIGYMWAWSVLN